MRATRGMKAKEGTNHKHNIIIHSSSLTFNVTRTQSVKNKNSLPHRGSVERFPVVKMTSGYMPVLFISIGLMPFLVPTTLDNADLLFILVKH